jgi:hypothetical protein
VIGHRGVCGVPTGATDAAHRQLHPASAKAVSAVRERLLTQALADRMVVGSQDRRVQRAATMWSAIMAGAYIGQLHMPPNYDPQQDDRLSERMIANLSETFAEVMGEAPGDRNDCRRV